MSVRIRVAAVAVLCLFAASVAWAQQPERPDLERRLAELEKQLGVLLKEVKALRQELQSTAAQPAPARMEMKIFTLRNADPVEMTRILQELFQGREGKTMRITADPRTNSVLIHSRTDLLEVIEAVVARLDEPRTRDKGAEPVKKSSRPAEKRRTELERRLAQAESDVAMQKDRATWSQRMAKLGYLSASQVQVETLSLDSAEAALDKAKTELKTLLADPQEPDKQEAPKKK